MEAKSLRIVFMGTPEFAVPSLRALVEGGYNVVGVVTTPDKPAGRGQKLHQSDVKVEALRLGLPILQPEKLRDETFLQELSALKPDLGIIIAFRMLPEVVWSMPPFGTFNLHASLLPQYRGAAPINHAIINGEKVSGITTFLLNHEIDKGGILSQTEVEITEDDNVGTLYDKLMNLGKDLVVQTVENIAKGDIAPINQMDIDESTLKPAPKIFKDNCKLDWNWSAERIRNFVRGLSPYPAAWCSLMIGEEQSSAKIFDVSILSANDSAEIGTLQSDGKSYIKVRCSDGWISINSLQIAGKKRLATKDLLLGIRDINLFKTL